MVGGSVLSDTSQMSLEDVVSIQESLFTIGLDPYLVLAVFGEVVKAGDVELELHGFGAELSKAGAC